MDVVQFEVRKREHIDQALDSQNQALGLTGLDQVHLHHEALPEIDFEEVQLSRDFMGQSLRTPFFVAGMTMGHPDAAQINQVLAQVCQARGWIMGVGSQRRELEGGSLSEESLQLRRIAPQAVFLANLGISQVIHSSLGDIRRVVDGLGAQALVIHLNALQEALQMEGTPQFRGGLQSIARLVKELGVPVLVKETGCGFSPSTLKKLGDVGVYAVDVSGLGGTHWGRIEGARASSSSVKNFEASRTFGNWGESTVSSVLSARGVVARIWASGGVRNGLDAAKLIALGADSVGYAQPALRAAMGGVDVLHRWMEQQEFELRVALFCTGCTNLTSLRQKEGVCSYERS